MTSSRRCVRRSRCFARARNGNSECAGMLDCRGAVERWTGRVSLHQTPNGHAWSGGHRVQQLDLSESNARQRRCSSRRSRRASGWGLAASQFKVGGGTEKRNPYDRLIIKCDSLYDHYLLIVDWRDDRSSGPINRDCVSCPRATRPNPPGSRRQRTKKRGLFLVSVPQGVETGRMNQSCEQYPTPAISPVSSGP